MEIFLGLGWYLAGVVGILVYLYFEQGRISRSDLILSILFGVLGIIALLCFVIGHILAWVDNDDTTIIRRKKK